MKRQTGTIAAAGLAACLLAGGALTGCAGPSTRVLPRDVVIDQPYEIPEENQVLEEVNPFYLQESLNYLSGFTRNSGTPGEGEAAAYIRRLLGDYGYETQLQSVSVAHSLYGGTAQGTTVIGTRKASAPDADILILAANHDTLPGSPGANQNASGVVTLLECARLLSGLSTDTEIWFVSFAESAESRDGSCYYVDSLTEAQQKRIIGVIQLDTLGYVQDSQVVLGTLDGKETLLGDLLKQAYQAAPGLTQGWQYALRAEGDHLAFIRGGIPAVVVSQAMEAYESGTPQDRAGTVNVEVLANVADIVSHTIAGIMSSDTPSQLAKSRFMNNLQDGSFVQRRDSRFPFGEDYAYAENRLGARGSLVSSNQDGTGSQVDTYQYRMKWFDVDQIIMTNYHYSDGKLETISLDADGAGVDFEEMKERIGSWYGEPAGENNGPNGTEYDWIDPLYHKFIALIPENGGFDVEIRDYMPEQTVLGTYLPDGTVIEQAGTDMRIGTLLDMIRDIIPAADYEGLGRISVYTDGIASTTGYLEISEAEALEPDEETASQSVLWVDLEDALLADGSWRNRTATVKLLVQCYGSLIKGRLEGMAEAAPEFEEDFMRFVLFQKPEEIRDPSDGRIQFFYDYEELVNIRGWIRRNLQLSNETPTEILPPEGSVTQPEP